MFVADELHVAEVVRSLVLPSLNVLVAVNCCVAWTTIEGFDGVTAMDVGVGGTGFVGVEPDEPPPHPQIKGVITEVVSTPKRHNFRPVKQLGNISNLHLRAPG